LQFFVSITDVVVTASTVVILALSEVEGEESLYFAFAFAFLVCHPRRESAFVVVLPR
jgi:hypothetical protein